MKKFHIFVFMESLTTIVQIKIMFSNRIDVKYFESNENIW